METKIKNNITDNVADTLFIPLAMKRNESNKPDAFFHDPFASIIIDKVDYDFSKYDKAILSSIGVAIRAKYFDEMTSDFIEKHDKPVVVNIGCGLDTRFQRIGKAITNKAMFYELDLPESITLRKQLLPESENDIYIASSMFETGWMKMLTDKHPEANFLLIIEGVLMYFETEQVKNLFQSITRYFANAELLFDVVSSWMCRNSHRHETVKLTNAVFKHGCDDDRQMENWSEKLTLESAKRFNDFAAWKRTGFVLYNLMRFVPAIRNSGRLLHYTIGKISSLS